MLIFRRIANLMGRGDIIKLFILFKTLSPLFRSLRLINKIGKNRWIANLMERTGGRAPCHERLSLPTHTYVSPDTYARMSLCERMWRPSRTFVCSGVDCRSRMV